MLAGHVHLLRTDVHLDGWDDQSANGCEAAHGRQIATVCSVALTVVELRHPQRHLLLPPQRGVQTLKFKPTDDYPLGQEPF